MFCKPDLLSVLFIRKKDLVSLRKSVEIRKTRRRVIYLLFVIPCFHIIITQPKAQRMSVCKKFSFIRSIDQTYFLVYKPDQFWFITGIINFRGNGPRPTIASVRRIRNVQIICAVDTQRHDKFSVRKFRNTGFRPLPNFFLR